MAAQRNPSTGYAEAMRRAVVGAYTYLEFAACVCSWVPILFVVRTLHRHDSTPRIAGRWLRRMGRTAAKLSPLWDFSVDGEAPADIGEQAYVVVANHESNADPFLLSFLPWDMRWIAKEEMFRVPVVGTIMRLSGDIPLKRGDRGSVEEMMSECRRTLEGGLSVMIFPEGTRSRDGDLLPFKDGAFALAIEAQVPILPVAIEGTRTCMPKGSRWLGEAHATATVLQPIPTKGLGRGDVPSLRDTARTQIIEALDMRRAGRV
jgi:1-acyl-sn-glycerol-3-phosphate acyltransferase